MKCVCGGRQRGAVFSLKGTETVWLGSWGIITDRNSIWVLTCKHASSPKMTYAISFLELVGCGRVLMKITGDPIHNHGTHSHIL